MTAAIATKSLTKYYGKTAGIIDLDLEVQPGEVFGFLGPNGAGKSTTIRLLLSLIYPPEDLPPSSASTRGATRSPSGVAWATCPVISRCMTP